MNTAATLLIAVATRLIVAAGSPAAADPAALAPPVPTAETAVRDTDDGDRLKIVATVPTYGLLAETIGGELVDVITLTRPGQDVHGVMATPSLMARVRDSDLCLFTGLDAELWLDPMLRGSGNVHLLPGNPDAIVLSDGVDLKQIPPIVDRNQGDVHAWGNVHIWTDPLVVRSMAERVREELARRLPEHADEIDARHAAFHKELTEALVRWLTEYRDLKGRLVVVHHRSWIYFLERFGMVEEGNLEPKPRVAPTAAHLAELEALMKARGVKVIVREPYHALEPAEHASAATGAEILELSTHPGWPEGVDGIIEHFDYNLRSLAEALRSGDG